MSKSYSQTDDEKSGRLNGSPVTRHAANKRNLALGKPATQSSVSQWSSAQTPESDAGVATNGDTASPLFFHTADENEPWWQVDLADEFVIQELRIFNRQGKNADRLQRFTILVSLNGVTDSWLPIYCKNDSEIFGTSDTLPFQIKLATPSLARFVRIRKDDGGFLHFRECEVFGYRPEAEDLVLLREQMEQTRKHLTGKQAAIDSELADGRTGLIMNIDSHTIFIDTEKYSPALVDSLKSGAYEASERHLVGKILRSTDRVLELGTAVGVVTMMAARIVGPRCVMTYDANPAMIADARRNFAANGMGEISAHVGVLRNRGNWLDDETEVDFFVSHDFWASRLHATRHDPDIASVIKVPLVCLESKIAEHQANVLICDIEGAEADLLVGADLQSIRSILMEIHYGVAGRRSIDDMIRFLILQGFSVDLSSSAHSIVLLDR
jgi:FkbM family methyltransferase